MAIGNSDGSIVLTTKVEDAGLKSGMNKIVSDQKKQLNSLVREYAKLITNNKKNTDEAKKLKEQINELSKEIKETEKTMGSFGQKSSSAFASIEKSATAMAFAISAAFVATLVKATKEVIEFSKESSQVAMNAESSVLRLVDIYGEASDAVGDFIDKNATALGMSKAAAASFASVYGNLFSVWADSATNANLTNEYLRMTAVVASKTGRTVEDVQERVRSGLLGNTEAIEDLGIFVNVKTIEMTDAFRRMANGKSWEQLDAYSQQQIRTMAILEQATAKYGDQVAEASILAKSQLSAAWQDFQATWGKAVNTILIPILQVVAEIVQVATIGLQTLLGYSGNILEDAESVTNSIDKAADSQDKLTESIKETEKAQKGVLAGFDDINILSSKTTGNQDQWLNAGLNLGLSGTDNQVVTELETFKEECLEILAPLEEALSTLFDGLTNAYNLAKENVFVPLSEWFEEEFAPETIQKYSDNIDNFSLSIDNLNQELEEMGETPLESFFSSVIETISGFVSIWSTYINDIFSPVFSNFSELIIVIDVVWGLVDNLVTTVFSGYATSISSLVTGVVELFSLVGNLMGATSEAVATMWSLITGDFDGAKQHFVNMLKYLANAALSIINVFIAALNFVWAEIYAVVGGIINGIGGALEAIAATAGLEWDLSWDGTSTPTIPYIEKLDIPKLAQGAVIPPNREFLAVLGDQKQGTNIETPLATMIEAFQMALDSRGGYNGGGNTEVILEIDGREFGRAVVEQGNRENRRIGTRLVIS